MATGTDAGGTWNTTAGNKTVIATPASNDLIVVVHGMSGWASADDSVGSTARRWAMTRSWPCSSRETGRM